MSSSISRKRPVRIASALLLALCVFSASASVALAHGSRSRTGFRHNVVAAASGVVQTAPASGSFTIETRSGTVVTVNTSGTTTYLEHGVSSPTLTDVGTGDLVAVFGTISGSTVTATEIVIKPQSSSSSGTTAPAGAGLVTGTPGTDSFTITTHSGATETIDVSGTTTYSERGVTSATLSDVAANDFVVVFGTLSGSTITATQVVIGSGHGHHAFRVAGAVATAPAADSFTITTHSGATETVDVSSTTQYYERGVTGADLTSVVTGDFIAAFGTISGSTITADRILIIPAPSASASNSGTSATVGTVQTAPASGEFVIETHSGTQLTVDTSSATTYSERGNSSASLTDVAIGEDVAVFGTTSGSTITATQVAIGGVGFDNGPGFCPPHGGGNSASDPNSNTPSTGASAGITTAPSGATSGSGLGSGLGGASPRFGGPGQGGSGGGGSSPDVTGNAGQNPGPGFNGGVGHGFHFGGGF